MINLIKGEYYRLFHSNRLWIWGIVLIALFPFACLITEKPWYNNNLTLTFVSCGNILPAAIPIVLATYVSCCLVFPFLYRTCFYENMFGYKTIESIVAKMMVYISYLLLLMIVTLGTLFLFIFLKNGIGELTNIFPRLLLLLVVAIHVILDGLLFSLLLRNFGGIALSIIRFSFVEGMLTTLIPQLFYQKYSEAIALEKETKFCDWFMTSQLTSLFLNPLSSHLIMTIFLSLIIEAGILFSFVYFRMQKRIKL